MSLSYIIAGVILLFVGLVIYKMMTEQLFKMIGVIIAVIGVILLIVGLIYMVAPGIPDLLVMYH